MKSRFHKLFFKQTAQKIEPYISLRTVTIPSGGWIEVLRKALGMSMKQLGDKIGKSAQAINEVQKREKNGTITLNSLREVAAGMGMKLVYAIVPADYDSLEVYVQKLAEKKAIEIVNRANNTMTLEAQAVNNQRRNNSIAELTEEFINEPQKLWD